MTKHIRMVVVLLVIGGALSAAATGTVSAAQAPEAVLEGRAVLPADTFAPGPPSGSQLSADETKGGRTPPFEGQPLGGVSAVLAAGNG